MSASFQKPSSLALCIFSVLWIVCAAGFAIVFVLGGKILSALIMCVFGIAAVGLWFQSRIAAWVLIAFICAGTIYGLLSIGHTPILRVILRVCWAAWSIMLLIEFLKNDSSS